MQSAFNTNNYKTKLDHLINIGPQEEHDPYFEQIPEHELHFYQRKGARRKRKLPDFIPQKDLKILNSVKRKAYRLDLQLSMCGLRLGWAGVIGLIPGFGDIIGVLFALQLVSKASSVDGGLPEKIRLQMISNVVFDFVIGLIPFVGDFMNILYKCNSRNFIILEKHLVEKYSAMVPVPESGPGSGKSASQPPPPAKPNLPPRDLV